MNTRLSFILGAAIALSSTAAIASIHGPHFEEDDDAGSLPEDSKKLYGDGQLLTIQGALTGGSRGQGDYQDMYQIYIAQPGEFQLRVADASFGFDTQLFLFDLEGRGMLANNDSIIDGQESLLSLLMNHSTDGTNVVVQTPGLYYIAISGFSSRPMSQNGNIFFFNPETPFEVSGPDGQGGNAPITGWNHPGDTGGYFISLSGVNFIPVPAPGALALLGLAGLAGRRRRRHC